MGGGVMLASVRGGKGGGTSSRSRVVITCPTRFHWADDVAAHTRRMVDDVLPTSLNEGRGGIGSSSVHGRVLPGHEAPSGGWSCGGGTSRRWAAQMWKLTKCGRVGNRAILGRARNGISRGVEECQKL